MLMEDTPIALIDEKIRVVNFGNKGWVLTNTQSMT